MLLGMGEFFSDILEACYSKSIASKRVETSWLL